MIDKICNKIDKLDTCCDIFETPFVDHSPYISKKFHLNWKIDKNEYWNIVNNNNVILIILTHTWT